MADDVLLNKTGIIERCLRRVREKYDGTPAHLHENITKQDVRVGKVGERVFEGCMRRAAAAGVVEAFRLANVLEPKDGRLIERRNDTVERVVDVLPAEGQARFGNQIHEGVRPGERRNAVDLTKTTEDEVRISERHDQKRASHLSPAMHLLVGAGVGTKATLPKAFGSVQLPRRHRACSLSRS